MSKEKKEIMDEQVTEEVDSADAVTQKAHHQAESAESGSDTVTTLSQETQQLLDAIEKMSVLELNSLVKALEKKFGVSAAAPIAVAATSGAQANSGSDEPAEEKTSFEVTLTDMGSNKLAVIKAVREIKPDLGLKDAKDLVESAPKTLLEGAKKEAAEEAKAKIEQAGGKVELK